MQINAFKRRAPCHSPPALAPYIYAKKPAAVKTAAKTFSSALSDRLTKNKGVENSSVGWVLAVERASLVRTNISTTTAPHANEAQQSSLRLRLGYDAPLTADIPDVVRRQWVKTTGYIYRCRCT